MSNKQIRIKANIGQEQVVRVNLKQGVDTFDMLSLSVSADGGNGSEYKRFASPYGVIIGRVTVNGGVGVPNAKVSIFVPLTETDELRSDIVALYPYKRVTDTNSEGKRYNLLPAMYYDSSHVAVGSFPTPQMVLDNDIYVEIFEKYYKYSTVTNDAGDYMLYGVPTGSQTIHMDVDLSDIGFLSQKPSDFVYKGYSEDMFNGNKFIKTEILDEAPQIESANDTITVYPFWGDPDENEIAITRKDFNLSYVLTPSAVFMGTCFTDKSENYISENCGVNGKCGRASQLINATGVISVIRERTDGLLEEISLSDALIDENGNWCTNIPMNLSYITTSEEGQLVSTTDSTIGIPTRARVRLKMSLDDELETNESHTAIYYIPNNDANINIDRLPVTDEMLEMGAFWDTTFPESWDKDEEYYKKVLMRDLLWNCVYSVKNYIPRLQLETYDNGQNMALGETHTGLKAVTSNEANGINWLPYNKLNLKVTTSLGLGEMLSFLNADFKRRSGDPTLTQETSLWTRWARVLGLGTTYHQLELLDTYDGIASIDEMYGLELEEQDMPKFDFYNDWLNGSLYFPKFARSLTTDNEVRTCQCTTDRNVSAGFFFSKDTCAIDYTGDYAEQLDLTDISHLAKVNSIFQNINGQPWALPYEAGAGTNNFNTHSSDMLMGNGIIYAKKNESEDGEYYTFSYSPTLVSWWDRVAIGFRTDLILLGSIDDNNIFGIPHVKNLHLPVTTCNKVPTHSVTIPWNPNVHIVNPDEIDEQHINPYGGVQVGLNEYHDNFETEDSLYDVQNPYEDDEKYDPNQSWYEALYQSINPEKLAEGFDEDVFYKVNGAYWGRAEYTPYIAVQPNSYRLYNENEAMPNWYNGTTSIVGLAQTPPYYFVDVTPTSDEDDRIVFDGNPMITDVGRHCLMGEGLFFGINAFSFFQDTFVTKPKTCINLSRICELSVTNENSMSLNPHINTWVNSDTTGIIGEDQITTHQYRSLFATLNSFPLVTVNTGVLPRYTFRYYNINSFDGTLNNQLLKETRLNGVGDIYPTVRYKEKTGGDSLAYKQFRYGTGHIWYRRYVNQIRRTINTVNSFYFYFGLHDGATALDKLKKRFF